MDVSTPCVPAVDSDELFARRLVTDSASVIGLAGVVTPATVILLYREMSDALAKSQGSIVIDLSDVHVLSPRVAALLCGALRRLNRSGRHVRLFGGPVHVQRLLTILWLLPQGEPHRLGRDAASGAHGLRLVAGEDAGGPGRPGRAPVLRVVRDVSEVSLGRGRQSSRPRRV